MPRPKNNNKTNKSSDELPYILIIGCKTEVTYLEKLFWNIDNPKILYQIIDKHTIPNEKFINTIDKIFKERTRPEFKTVYHVFDLERPISDDQEVNKCLKYIKNIEDKYKNVFAITQMPSIEVWFLNHFVDVTHGYENANEVETALKKKCKAYNKTKTSYETWQEIIGKTQIALDNYEANKSKYEQLSGNFANYGITNPMMQIADLIIELSRKAK